jgi:hypothetical protein
MYYCTTYAVVYVLCHKPLPMIFWNDKLTLKSARLYKLSFKAGCVLAALVLYL